MERLPRATPFLKWAGGKQRLAGALLDAFPARVERYFEPFLGGGAVVLAMGHPRTVAGDANAWLVDTYAAVRDDWRAVAAALDALPNTRADYLRLRDVDPAALDPAARAARFVYLNKTGFRGLFRVNRQGRFNVPYGAYARRYYDPANLAACAAALRGIDLRAGDFEALVAGAGPGDFVYFDPPYHKSGGYSDFTRYTPSQFREGDHARLAALCRALDARGVAWAVSNSDTALVRDLFAGYRVTPLAARRDINLRAARRAVSEVLVTNYERPRREAGSTTNP